jgi:hypothetical protein
MEQRIGIGSRWGIGEREFLDAIFAHVDVRGSRVPAAGGAP